MTFCRMVLIVSGALLIAGCVHRTRPDCDPCVRNSSACQPVGTCSAQTAYDVSWDKTCADYPVSYRAVVAELQVEPADPPRRLRAGDLIESGRVQ